MVSAFQIEWRFRAAPAIQAASVPICLEESGYAAWNGRLLELLRERMSEPPPEGQERALRDAAFRFAVRLQQAAEKLREVAPLLAENEEDDNVVLAEMDEETSQPAAMAAKASASQGSPAPAKSGRPVAPRWP